MRGIVFPILKGSIMSGLEIVGEIVVEFCVIMSFIAVEEVFSDRKQ